MEDPSDLDFTKKKTEDEVTDPFASTENRRIQAAEDRSEKRGEAKK